MGLFGQVKKYGKAIGGNPEAKVEVGLDALKQGNIEFARSQFCKAAIAGNPRGMSLWGQSLIHGANQPVDIFSGLVQIMKAAVSGDFEAEAALIKAFDRYEVKTSLFLMENNGLELLKAMMLSNPNKKSDALEIKLADDLIKIIEEEREN
jgi:hypothetical protein